MQYSPLLQDGIPAHRAVQKGLNFLLAFFA